MVTWNVRGSMRSLDSCTRVMGILRHYDVVALTHTGADAEPVLQGFRCMHVLTRPFDPESGGVAVFAKEHLAPKCAVVRHHAELGMVWLKVDHDRTRLTPTYMCALYLPHERSSYYEHVDKEAHWQALNADIAEFAASGSILLVGDWNSRAGRESDLGDREEDELEQLHAHTGIPVPPTTVHRLDCPLPKRACMDRSTNAMGRRLLRLCRSHGLAIMNGRLPGDERGLWTFYGPRGAKSMIDVVVASPQLAFTGTGTVKQGARMHVVTDPDRLPARPGAGGRFDHAPVGVRVRPPPLRAGTRHAPQANNNGPPAVSWRWRPDLQDAYMSALRRPEVQEVWAGIASASDADAAVALFRAGLDIAVAAMHGELGRVVCVSGKGRRFGGPTNHWFDAACKQARAGWKHAVRLHGHESPEAREAQRTYRAQVRISKHAYEGRSQGELVRCLYDDPRQFWKRFQAERPQSTGFAAQEWTDWFERLLSANTAGSYEGGTLESHCQAFPDLFPEPSPQATAAAARLNDPFSTAEISAALAKLASHKAAGVDGMPAEFLTQAVNHVPAGPGNMTSREFVLAPELTALCNAVMNDAYPTAWQTSALVPVPKPKGRPDRKDDHRGIAVGPVVGKLYSLAWTARIDKWAEATGLRARGQAGFRAGRGTPEHMFVLRHWIDSARVRKQPLYCAFIDFSKAYDRVDRQLLLRILRGCGLHGRALHALASMIEVTRMQVRAQGELGTPFVSTAGVRQGCPASPVLFGILIDRLEAFLEHHCAQHGVRCASGSLLRALLYADDVVLMATTADGLQAMLDALQIFCRANSMFVNESKSEVVVYHGGDPCPRARIGFTYNGASLPIKDGYLYLGLWFKNGQHLRSALDGAADKARRAMYGMFSRCYAMKMHNVNLQCHLFDSLVRPLLCYGCEVWGVDWVSEMCRAGNFASGKAEEEVHKPFLRQSLGVCKSTPTAALYQELGRYPVTMFWLRMAAQLWNRALARPGNDWLRVALDENVSTAHDPSLTAANRRLLWSHHFTKCMEELGIAWQSPMGVKLQVDCKALVQSMMARWRAFEGRDALRAMSHQPAWLQVSHAVRAAPDSFSKGFKHFVYNQWFAPDRWRRKECWAFHLHKPEHIRAMAQFRLGSHWLEVQRGRFAKPRIPRSSRCCHACHSIEDELHVLECPLYAPTRTSILGTLPPLQSDTCIKAYFNKTAGQDWLKFAAFLAFCKRCKMDTVDR